MVYGFSRSRVSNFTVKILFTFDALFGNKVVKVEVGNVASLVFFRVVEETESSTGSQKDGNINEQKSEVEGGKWLWLCGVCGGG